MGSSDHSGPTGFDELVHPTADETLFRRVAMVDESNREMSKDDPRQDLGNSTDARDGARTDEARPVPHEGRWSLLGCLLATVSGVLVGMVAMCASPNPGRAAAVVDPAPPTHIDPAPGDPSPEELLPPDEEARGSDGQGSRGPR